MRQRTDVRKLAESVQRRIVKIRFEHDEVWQPIMRPTTGMSSVGKYAERRVERCLDDFKSENGRVFTSYAVMELDNLIIAGFRWYLVSVVAGARGVEGVRGASALRGHDIDVIKGYILSAVDQEKLQRIRLSGDPVRERDMPIIRDPRRVRDIMLEVGATPSRGLLNALTYNPPVFSEIATFRNFFAHRNEETYQKVVQVFRNWGHPNVSSVFEIETFVKRDGRVPVLRSWISQLERFFEILFHGKHY